MKRLLLGLSLLALAGPAVAQAPLRHIAVTGETAPGTGGGTYFHFQVPIVPFPFVDFVAPALQPNTEADTVAFFAEVVGGTASQGIFLDEGGVDSAVVLTGQAAPGTGGGTFDRLWAPGINGRGTVAFEGEIAGGTASEGLFTARDGVITPRVLTGAPAPGTGGGTFDSFRQYLGTPIARGDSIAFQAGIAGGSTDAGIFAESGGTVTPIAVEGDVAPGTGGGTFSLLSAPVGNGAGELAFEAWIDGASATRGVFRVDAAGSISAVALEGDPAPETGGGTYLFFEEVAIGLSRIVSFGAKITGGTTNSGLFAHENGVVRRVVVQGGPAPGSGGGTLQAGSLVSDVVAWSSAVDGRRVLYPALVTGGDVDTVLNFASTTLARDGTNVLTVPGLRIDEIGGRLSGDRGWVAFNATTTGFQSGSGVFAVPALPPVALVLTAAGLLGTGALRRPPRRLAVPFDGRREVRARPRLEP